MKNIYFFGCSFTAGDELSDAKWFPWKFTDKPDRDAYYNRRSKAFSNHEFLQAYIKDNKELAYPALMNTDEITTHNLAENGGAVRANMLRLLEVLASGQIIDAIYFQVPPVFRELFIYPNGNFTDIQVAVIHPHFIWKDYLKEKVLSHNPIQWAVEDLMDLIMLTSHLKTLNIPVTFLEFGKEIEERYIELENEPRYHFLIEQAKSLPTINVNNIIKKRGYQLAGDHWSQESHEDLAEFITEHFKQIINSK